MMSRINPVRSCLWLVLGVALVLRLWGNSFGLPLTLHPDEGFEINRALQLASGSFNYERVGKGGYFYLLFLEYGLYFAISLLLGFVHSAKEFAALFIQDPTGFYLIGRCTTAVVGTVVVYLTYRFATRISTPGVGLICASLLAVNPLHIELSHYTTVDIPLAFLCLLTLLLISKLTVHSTLRQYLLIGALIAAATFTKVPGVLLVIPLVIMYFCVQISGGKSVLTALLDKKVYLTMLVFIGVFIVGNPGVIVNMSEYFGLLFGLYDPTIAIGTDGYVTAAEDSESSSYLSYYAYHTVLNVPPIVLILGAIGLVMAFFQKRFTLIAVAGFSLALFLVVSLTSSQDLVFERYLAPIIPCLILLACPPLHWLSQRIGKPPIRVVVAVAFTVIMGFFHLERSIGHNIRLWTPDTREVAYTWFLENIPAGSSVMVEGFSARAGNYTLPLKNTKENLTDIMKMFRERGEPGKAYYFQLDRDLVQAQRYDVTFIPRESIPNWSQIQAEGVEYIVIRPEHLQRRLGDSEQLKFFDAALQSGKLFDQVYRIAPADHQPGPVIEIYRVKPSAASADA